MKKLVFVVFSIASVCAGAASESRGLNFNSPTVNDKANVSDPKMGEIVFDTSDNIFYGNTDGTGGGWTALSIPLASNVIVSSGTQRVESAKINCSSSSSVLAQNGNWVASVSNISGGQCTVTLNSGIFGATPICAVNRNGQNVTSITFVHLSPASATSIVSTAAVISSGNSTISASTNYNFDVVCAGTN
jgi:hypothetical protein